LGDYEKAIEYFKRAIKLNPNYAAAFSNTGIAFYRLGCLQKAIEYFDKAIEADPKYVKAYNYKVLVLMEKEGIKKP